MLVTNIADDYDNITSINLTHMLNVTSSIDKMTISNCVVNESDTDVFLPSLLLTITCGLSLLCMLSLMVYTKIKPLFNNK